MGKTAVIIGAGPAGLTAAYYLLKETDIKPVILEADNQVGGIAKTVAYHGNLVDLGGHRFFSKSPEVVHLWESLCIPQNAPSKDELILKSDPSFLAKGADPEKEEAVFLIRRRISRIFFLNKFFDYPLSIKFKTFLNMGFFNTIKSATGYIYASIFQRKENSLEDFYINRFGKPLYQMFFENYTEKIWGKHPKDISPEWGAQRVKGLSLSKAVFNAIFKPKKKETSLIESFSYPKRGCGQMWDLMAEYIQQNGGQIIKNATVKKITLSQNKIVSVTASLKEGSQDFSGDYFLSSMPIKDLIDSIDTAPEGVKEIATSLPYRDFMTVAVLVPKLLIKNETHLKTIHNLIPDTWVYVQEPHVKMCRFQVFNNWSPYMVKDFENTVWIGLEYVCDETDDIWKMTDKDFIDFAINEFSSVGIIDKKDVLDAVRLKIKKAYPAYFGSYQHFDKVKDYLNSFENLYCIGRNGQHRYNNMDHSMLTAIEAVRSIKNKTDKTAIWNINTEKEYHEEKK